MKNVTRYYGKSGKGTVIITIELGKDCKFIASYESHKDTTPNSQNMNHIPSCNIDAKYISGENIEELISQCKKLLDKELGQIYWQ